MHVQLVHIDIAVWDNAKRPVVTDGEVGIAGATSDIFCLGFKRGMLLCLEIQRNLFVAVVFLQNAYKRHSIAHLGG